MRASWSDHASTTECEREQCVSDNTDAKVVIASSQLGEHRLTGYCGDVEKGFGDARSSMSAQRLVPLRPLCPAEPSLRVMLSSCPIDRSHDVRISGSEPHRLLLTVVESLFKQGEAP